MRRAFTILAPAIVAVTAVTWLLAPSASAGIALQPASGTTTSTRPTFVAYLEPQELGLATVYVAPDNQMDSSFYPLHQTGSCYPSTPTGAQSEYSCQPFAFSSLAPGTYYWWLRYYHRDAGSFTSTLRISGPLLFVVPQPTPPVGAGQLSPYDGALVSTTPTLRVHVPANARYEIYVSPSSGHVSDGSPSGGTSYSCSGTAAAEGDYQCTVDGYSLDPGRSYFWWTTIDVGDTNWIYTPRSFTVYAPPSGGGGGGGGGSGGSGNNGPHAIEDAALLPASAHYGGDRSIKHTRLSSASYGLSKALRVPKSIAVACWNAADWTNIGADSRDGLYSTQGFYRRSMPHWVHLSPTVCKSLETLLYARPARPNLTLANGLDTVTHEMIHALGETNEARTECFSMQLSYITARYLQIPAWYALALAKLTLGLYLLHPAQYIDTIRCREGGMWDLVPLRPSLPWH
jgi:hypothetical protein